MKELYPDDTDFGEIYLECEIGATNGFFSHDGFFI
jgi:hypothetical protein